MAVAFDLDVGMVEQTLEERIVSCKRNSLVIVIEIIDVVIASHRDASNDARVDALRRSSPLFRSVTAEERIKNSFRMGFVLHEFIYFAGRKLGSEKFVD